MVQDFNNKNSIKNTLFDNGLLQTLSTADAINKYTITEQDQNAGAVIMSSAVEIISSHLGLDKDNEFTWPDNIQDNELDKGTCLGTRSHIAILVNGDIVPCCLDSKGILKLGNIFEDELEDVLKSELFLKLNQGFKDNKLTCNLCKNCNFRIMKFNK